MLIESLNLGRPLDGEVALVTGAGRGIGRETALALSALGASIVILEIDDSGKSTEKAIWDRGGQARFFQVDVSDPTAMEGLKQQAIARFNRVDIVINNAVTFVVKPLVDYTIEEWDRVMAVNLRGAFLTAKLFLPSMVAQGHGVFVTMQSGDGMPYMAPYFASKVALRSLAGSLSQEVGNESGISVFCFGAGMVDTPAIREAVPRLAPLYGLSEQDFIKQSAPGGVLMSAEECATGLAGCVLHAAELHGQEPAAITGLGLLGVKTSEWSSADPAAPVRAKAEPAVADVADSLADLIAGLRNEYESLGLFQRQWYKRTLKQRSGMSLDEWSDAASEIRKQPAGAARYIPALRRLAAYFAQLESDARGYIHDPTRLGEAIAALEDRRAVAEKAASVLG